MQKNLSKKSSDFSNQITHYYRSIFSNLPIELQEKVKKELIKKYKKNHIHLDSKFLSDILSADERQIKNGLWEFIMIDRLTQSSEVTHIDAHKDDGPDWCIQLKNGKKYYVEATCAGFPQKQMGSELHRAIEEIERTGETSWGNDLIEEAKSRISTRIMEKLVKHENLVKGSNTGYILLVSYPNLGIEHRHAIRTIMPVGGLTLAFERNITGHTVITDQYLPYQDSYKKMKPTGSSTDKKYAEIQTNILGNEKHNWVSAILFSEIPHLYLLEEASTIPDIQWGKQNNDFVLVHNPTASNPLDIDIFNSATVLKFVNDQLIEEGVAVLEKFAL